MNGSNFAGYLRADHTHVHFEKGGLEAFKPGEDLYLSFNSDGAMELWLKVEERDCDVYVSHLAGSTDDHTNSISETGLTLLTGQSFVASQDISGVDHPADKSYNLFTFGEFASKRFYNTDVAGELKIYGGTAGNNSLRFMNSNRNMIYIPDNNDEALKFRIHSAGTVMLQLDSTNNAERIRINSPIDMKGDGLTARAIKNASFVQAEGELSGSSIHPYSNSGGLELNFSACNTTKSKITLGDNLADALNITEAGNSYLKFVTSNSSEKIEVYKDFIPNGSVDLGSDSNRFANIYTNDLNLCNEGRGNDVDGTSGNWTIQEGEDNLYVINNITGKKFKMMLQPVEDGE